MDKVILMLEDQGEDIYIPDLTLFHCGNISNLELRKLERERQQKP